MFISLQPEQKPPACPMCAHEMALKTIHPQKTADHLIFKCGNCAIEYPVISDRATVA
jgi:transcription elongation factor Elf1